MLLWAAVVLCFAYLLPNHYSPWLSFHQELAAAIAFAPLIFKAATRAAQIPAISYGATCLAFIPLIQLATGQLYFRTDGWISTLYLLGFALVAHAGAQYKIPCRNEPKGRGTPSIDILWAALLISALISAGLAFHQWLQPTIQSIYIAELPPKSRPFGNLAQPNQLATLLLLGTVGLLYLWETRKIQPFLAAATCSVLLWALVMTGSRSILLSLFWFLPAFAIMRIRCHLRTNPSAIVAAVAFFFFITWFWPKLDDALLLNTEANTAVERMSSPGVRSLIWSSMLDAIGQSPLVGYGWGQISVAQASVTLNHPPTYLVLESAHNLFFDIALWNGLPVAFFVVTGLAIWIFHQVRKCNTPQIWITLVGVGVVFSHSMVEFPLNYAYFLLPVGFFMGALSGVYMTTPISPKVGIIRKIVPISTMVIATLATTLAVTVIVEYFPIEADWSLMRFQEARIANSEPTKQQPAFILSDLQQFLNFSRNEAEKGMSASEMEIMRRNSERFAYAAPMFKYALAQALNGQAEGALTTLRKLCSMQVPSVCSDAKNHWEELGRTRHPELLILPFPSDRENHKLKNHVDPKSAVTS